MSPEQIEAYIAEASASDSTRGTGSCGVAAGTVLPHELTERTRSSSGTKRVAPTRRRARRYR